MKSGCLLVFLLLATLGACGSGPSGGSGNVGSDAATGGSGGSVGTDAAAGGTGGSVGTDAATGGTGGSVGTDAATGGTGGSVGTDAATGGTGGSVQTPSFVRAVHNSSGGYLQDGSGNSVRLRGFNLGGWLMWQSWMWHAGWANNTAILQRLRDMLPDAEVSAFRKHVFQNYVTAADIQRIKQLGFNAVRIPFNHEEVESGELYTYLDPILQACASNEVYAILLLSSAPYPQNYLDLINNHQPGEPYLWDSWPLYKSAAPALWQGIANHYKTNAWIAGYDLLNEPATPWGGANWLPEEMAAIIDAIRAVDTNHMVIVEGDNYAQDFSSFGSNWGAPYDDNLAYSFHHYWSVSEKAGEPSRLAAWKSVSLAQGAPMLSGEFGGHGYVNNEYTKSLYQAEGPWMAGWLFWNWKVAQQADTWFEYQGVPAANQKWGARIIHVGPNWNQVIQYIAGGTSVPPSETVARAGLQEFRDAMVLDATTEDAALVQALD